MRRAAAVRSSWTSSLLGDEQSGLARVCGKLNPVVGCEGDWRRVLHFLRLAKALGATITELLPTEEPTDTLALLREQATRLFDGLLQSADRETLLMLNPLLAKLGESPARGR